LAAGLLGSIFLANCAWQSAPTWKTPAEWADLEDAARTVASLTKEDEAVIAPEAVLYYAGRRGYRLEFDPAATKRAAGEWGLSLEEPGPLALTNAYDRIHHLRATDDAKVLLVADVGREGLNAGRRAWREAIRRRPDTRILVDRPGSMIAELR
jgi:hypothetical protein